MSGQPSGHPQPGATGEASLGNNSPCIGCGALVPDSDGPTHRYLGASPGCWALIGDVWAKEYSDALFARVHQLSVDAYAVQHPGTPSRQTIRSVALHLIGLSAVFELGQPPHKATTAVRRAAESAQEFAWLEPPASLGALTVLDVHGASSPTDHAERVRQWAQSAWEAWGGHHATIRRWGRVT